MHFFVMIIQTQKFANLSYLHFHKIQVRQCKNRACKNAPNLRFLLAGSKKWGFGALLHIKNPAELEVRRI